METSNMAGTIKAEQGTNEPTPAQPVQQVMSPVGAQDEIRGLTPAEVEVIMKMLGSIIKYASAEWPKPT
jgi:hypothetical protein